jgi:acyl-CoA reductase-like NAD-dependent aldehyde dehydrogenase
MATINLINYDELYIGDTWVDPASDRRFRRVGATTEEPLGSVREGVEGDIDSVVEANDSDYGLGGTVFSSGTDSAIRVATGTVGVNGYVIDVNAPCGGIQELKHWPRVSRGGDRRLRAAEIGLPLRWGASHDDR